MKKKNYITPLMRHVATMNCAYLIPGSDETEEQYSKKRNFYNSNLDDEEEEDNSKFYVKY